MDLRLELVLLMHLLGESFVLRTVGIVCAFVLIVVVFKLLIRSSVGVVCSFVGALLWS
jgi:hypothetical protein